MTRKDQRILILYNEPRPAAGDPSGDAGQTGGPGHPKAGAWLESEIGVLDQVQAVAEALTELGLPHRTASVARLIDLPAVLDRSPEKIIFNLVEGFHERPPDCNLVPALCEAYGKSCTGGDTISLLTSLDKWQAKALMAAAGLPTAAGLVVRPGEKVARSQLPPAAGYIVKPACTDASEGIDVASCVKGYGAAMLAAVQRIHRDFHQPALIEKFVGHRELNVAVVQRGDEVRVLPLAEIDFSAFEAGAPRIVDYAAKWLPESFQYQNTPRLIPAPLPAAVARRVRQLAARAWTVLGCRDYARVDFRLDDELEPVVLEINQNPDISPEGGFAAALAAAGISFSAFIAAMIENARGRQALAAASGAHGTGR